MKDHRRRQYGAHLENRNKRTGKRRENSQNSEYLGGNTAEKINIGNKGRRDGLEDSIFGKSHNHVARSGLDTVFAERYRGRYDKYEDLSEGSKAHGRARTEEDERRAAENHSNGLSKRVIGEYVGG